MYNFILQILLMLSLGAMIYLIARAAPRIGDTIETAKKPVHSRLDRFLALLPVEKIDLIFGVFMEKWIRKLRLLLMKWDNLLAEHLNKIKKTNGEKEKTELFGENGELTNFEEKSEARNPKSETSSKF